MSSTSVMPAAPRPPAKASPTSSPSAAAVAAKGWLRAHRWLLARRFVQLALVGLFLLGPWAGLWIVKGNFSASLTLGVLPLTEPFVLAQVLASGHWPEATALTGAVIVLAFYALAGGRTYCSWVCPVNAATDAASWLRRRLRITSGRAPHPAMRYAVLAAVLAAAALTGVTVWEWVNPVSLTQRALVFGGTMAWAGVGAVFVYDLLVAPRGWCGHVCPQGALYALVGRASVLRVAATHSSRCNDCADCYAVCPEPRVIPLALKGKGGGRDGATPVITDAACTNCGRCIDVCSTDVFRFTHRWDSRRV